MAAQPPIPDNVLAATTNLADAFSSTTTRRPLDFLRPLVGVVRVLWEEVQRQQVLNVEHPLVTETGAVVVGKRSTALIKELHAACKHSQREETCATHLSQYCRCPPNKRLPCRIKSGPRRGEGSACLTCRAAGQLENL